MKKKTPKSPKLREVICCTCKKVFSDFVSPSELLKQPNRTCSRLCFSQHMREIQQRRSFLTNCPICQKEFRTQIKNPQIYCGRTCMGIGRAGHEVTKETRAKISAGRLGENNPYWKGGVHLYSSLHHRLKREYGAADICQNTQCKKKSKTYDWALKRGYLYEFRRENFYKLCRSCHRLYDYGKINIKETVDSNIDADDL